MSKTFTPPAEVARAARQGLELRRSLSASKRCCTAVGLRRASQLANRQPVSLDTLKRMRSYFARHEVDKQGRGWGVDSKGYQAWLLWGGDPGRRWAKQQLSRYERNISGAVVQKRMKPSQKRYKIATFDFDNTLLFSRFDSQLMTYVDDEPNYALIEELRRMAAAGTVIYIVTGRSRDLEDDKQLAELRSTVASFVRDYELPVRAAYFTEGAYKGATLKALGSQIHFDDDPEELAVARGFRGAMDLVLIRKSAP